MMVLSSSYLNEINRLCTGKCWCSAHLISDCLHPGDDFLLKGGQDGLIPADLLINRAAVDLCARSLEVKPV